MALCSFPAVGMPLYFVGRRRLAQLPHWESLQKAAPAHKIQRLVFRRAFSINFTARRPAVVLPFLFVMIIS